MSVGAMHELPHHGLSIVAKRGLDRIRELEAQNLMLEKRLNTVEEKLNEMGCLDGAAENCLGQAPASTAQPEYHPHVEEFDGLHCDHVKVGKKGLRMILKLERLLAVSYYDGSYWRRQMWIPRGRRTSRNQDRGMKKT